MFGGTTTLAHSQSSMAIDWLLLLLQCPWNGSGHCNSPRFIYPTIHIQKLVTLTLKKTEQLKKTVQHWMCLSWLAIHTYTYLCVRVYVCVYIYISQYIYTPKCYNFIILHIDIYIYMYTSQRSQHTPNAPRLSPGFFPAWNGTSRSGAKRRGKRPSRGYLIWWIYIYL